MITLLILCYVKQKCQYFPLSSGVQYQKDVIFILGDVGRPDLIGPLHRTDDQLTLGVTSEGSTGLLLRGLE